MKINKTLIIISLFFLIVTGCSTSTYNSTKWDGNNHSYDPLNINLTSELNADIEVNTSKKITGTAKGTYWLGLVKVSGDSNYQDGYGSGSPTGKVKEAAVYNALSKVDGDILVSPTYKIKKNTQTLLMLMGLGWVTITVEVSGYEGKIKNIQ